MLQQFVIWHIKEQILDTIKYNESIGLFAPLNWKAITKPSMSMLTLYRQENQNIANNINRQQEKLYKELMAIRNNLKSDDYVTEVFFANLNTCLLIINKILISMRMQFQSYHVTCHIERLELFKNELKGYYHKLNESKIDVAARPMEQNSVSITFKPSLPMAAPMDINNGHYNKFAPTKPKDSINGIFILPPSVGIMDIDNISYDKKEECCSFNPIKILCTIS